MSNAVYPNNFPGLAFSAFKTPNWATRTQRSVSGRELRVPDYANPIWNFTLTYSVLHDKPFGAYQTATALRTLMDFFLARQGSYDTFLFQDPDDNSVTGQFIANGDGNTYQFQLARQLIANGFLESITAPNQVTAIYLNGVLVDPALYEVDANTGILSFSPSNAPASNEVLTADFTYYFRVRFDADLLEFEKFAYQFWALKTVKLTSIIVPA